VLQESLSRCSATVGSGTSSRNREHQTAPAERLLYASVPLSRAEAIARIAGEIHEIGRRNQSIRVLRAQLVPLLASPSNRALVRSGVNIGSILSQAGERKYGIFISGSSRSSALSGCPRIR
jgi:hypothetical protein